MFPTPATWCPRRNSTPRTIQSGPRNRTGATGKGNPHRQPILGEATAAAARTDTFLGARYRRIARRRGKKKAIVAVGRSLLVIIWHLLADPDARFADLGADHYDQHINTAAKRRNHLRALEALGYRITLEPVA